jgi:hypothetical protein
MSQKLPYHLFEKKVFEAMNNSPKLITMWVDGDLLIMERPNFKQTTIPTHGELRLALEFVNDNYPLFKSASLTDKANFIRDIFNYNFPTKRLRAIKPFKKFIYRTIIISVKEHNGKYIVKTKKVLKHKQKYNK